MKKIWIKGQAYSLTDAQFKEFEDHVGNSIVPTVKHPESKGKRKLAESEDVAFEWLKKNKIDAGVALLFILGAIGTLIEFFISNSYHGVLAQIIIPALTTGAAVNTLTPAQSQVESDIMIGDIDTPCPIRGLKVNVDGDTTIDIQNSQPLLAVFSKLSQMMAGSGVIGLLYKIATGRVACKAATLTFTNDGATTPTVYWNSQRGQQKPGRLIRAKTTTINPNSNQPFSGSDFAYLSVTDPANVASFDFTFADGTQQNMTVVEADGLFSKTNQTESNGRLAPLCTSIDNTLRTISTVRINVGVAAVTVMLVQ